MTDGIDLSSQEKIKNPCGKGNVQILGNIGSQLDQTGKDERKNLKRVSQENEKATQNKNSIARTL